MATSRTYTDLDISFTKHPMTFDVGIKTDGTAIIQSIRNLIMTNYGERPFRPKLGSNLNKVLFEPLDDFSASIINSEIRLLLKNFEPRISVTSINVTPDDKRDSYYVTLTFSIVNSLKPLTIALFLDRLR